MRVGIVGGLDRNARELERAGAAAGHDVACHTGDTAGAAATRLAALCERSDLVIIVTDVNSHNAVRQARQLLRARGRTPVLVRRLSRARLTEILARGVAA